MTVEKRYHKRLDTDMLIHILHRGRHITTKAENITPYGIYLTTDNLTIPNGMLLELSVTLDDVTLPISGLVVWSSQKGIGVIFSEMQPTLYATAERHQIHRSSTKAEVTEEFKFIPRNFIFPPNTQATR